MKNRFLRFIIEGGAYIAARLPDNRVWYTKTHGFFIDDSGYLQTFKGERLDPPMQFTPPLGSDVMVDADGMVSELRSGQWMPLGYLIMNIFPHPEHLLYEGDNFYSETVASGSPAEGIAGSTGAFADVVVSAINMFPDYLYTTSAVLRVRPTEYDKLLRRANIVHVMLASVHILFPDPSPTLPELQLLIDELTLRMAQFATGRSHYKGMRNKAARNLYDALQLLADYVNRRSGGLAATLMVTGFVLHKFPNKQFTPDQIIIKAIEAAPAERSAKVRIMPPQSKKLKYMVQMSLSAGEDAKWTTVLISGNSRNLVVGNLPLHTAVYIRVAGMNNDGVGDYSAGVRFVAVR